MVEQHAVAVISGSAHVVQAATPAMCAIAGRPMVGMPLREAFPEPVYVGFFALVDWVRRFREEIRVVTPAAISGVPGVATINPIDGEDIIVIDWRPVPAVRGLEEARELHRRRADRARAIA